MPSICRSTYIHRTETYIMSNWSKATDIKPAHCMNETNPLIYQWNKPRDGTTALFVLPEPLLSLSSNNHLFTPYINHVFYEWNKKKIYYLADLENAFIAWIEVVSTMNLVLPSKMDLQGRGRAQARQKRRRTPAAYWRRGDGTSYGEVRRGRWAATRRGRWAAPHIYRP